MMTCKEFVDFLMDYVDEALPVTQRSAFDEHIEACPGCGIYLDQYRDTVRLGKSLCAAPDDPVPDDVPETLVNAILAARSR